MKDDKAAECSGDPTEEFFPCGHCGGNARRCDRCMPESPAPAQECSGDPTPRKKYVMSDDEKAAIVKAHETRSTVAELPDGKIMFINYGDDAQDYGDLDCPHCGGSGHKGDIKSPAPTQDTHQRFEAFAEYMNKQMMTRTWGGTNNWIVWKEATRQARDAAIEDCAKVCDDLSPHWSLREAAIHIRALKESK